MFVGKRNDNGCSVVCEEAIKRQVLTYKMMDDQKKLGHNLVSSSFIFWIT